MDIVAHTLWTNALFYTKYARQRALRYWAAFFGVVPDLVGFIPMFIYLVFSGQFGDPRLLDQAHWTMRYAVEAYNYTHSLIIFGVVFLVIAVIGSVRNKQVWVFWPLLGWGLHILIDIPSHAGDFFLTPFLFPLSDVKFTDGVSWGHPVFMLINYSFLVSVYIGITVWQRNRRKREHAAEIS